MAVLTGALESFAQLVVPILLILINTVATATGRAAGFMAMPIFLGLPTTAVGTGILLSCRKDRILILPLIVATLMRFVQGAGHGRNDNGLESVSAPIIAVFGAIACRMARSSSAASTTAAFGLPTGRWARRSR